MGAPISRASRFLSEKKTQTHWICLPIIAGRQTMVKISHYSCVLIFLSLYIYLSEFLIHAADVEGLCKGIDEDLVASTSFPLIFYNLPVPRLYPCSSSTK